jgi:chaperonin GroES
VKKEIDNFHPMPERIMVAPEMTPERSKGGLYIPETAKERTQFATVLEVGDKLPPYLKKGDKILCDKFAGTKINDGDTIILFLKMDDIIAYVR